MSKIASGGCQCGAVRFRASQFGRPSICHCRMCQKAFGSFFGPLVIAHDLVWTRGTPHYFASSNKVKRGFCGNCGTPLTYEYVGAPVEVAIGAFDDPGVVAPTIQVNPTDKLPFFDELCSLPSRPDVTEPEAEAYKALIVSYQHPDHDTDDWPVRGAR